MKIIIQKLGAIPCKLSSIVSTNEIKARSGYKLVSSVSQTPSGSLYPYRKLSIFIVIFSTLFCSNGDAKKFFPPPGFIFGTSRFQVFWSDPGISRETSVDKGIDNEWVKFIDASEKKIDVAVYNLGRQVIINALIKARERGVKVRMVGDVDESPTSGYQSIFRTDIPFSVGNSTGIQHNKFAIADDKFVMMGTGNLTDTDLLMNNNNYMIIESPTLVKSYTREFEQMFFGKYAGKKEPKTTNRIHVVNNTKLELYFSPYDGEDAMNRLIELIDGAKKEINYMIFAHTHDELSTALIRAAKRGVLVRGIHDYTFVRGTSMEASRLYNAGRFNSTGPFNKEDGNENTKVPGIRTSGGKLHCKTMIFDGQVVSTGSFNWSNNAINNNDENMLIIHSPLVANELLLQWNSIWNYGRPITNQITQSSGSIAKSGDVVFSEINWAGSYKNGASSGSPTKEDVWVELYNTTDSPIDISHWIITWDPDEVIHYAIPDRFSWFEPGVHKIHSSGRLIIPAKGYFLLKNANTSLPIINQTAFDNDSSDNKFSGTKNFSLSSAFLKLKLYDTNMNLIDEAGDGTPPLAGALDSFNFRTHSMERFFNANGKAYLGTSQGSWYTSNGNNGLGTTINPLLGTGRLSDDYNTCELGKGCSIGTPNARFNSNFASSPSNARGGILGLTNIPIYAYSISSTEAIIQMRWAMQSPPIVSGASNIRISPTDPAKLIISIPQIAGQIYTVTVNSSGLDATNQTIDGGVVSFTGFTSTKASVYISRVYPSESSSNGDKIELTATTSGNVNGLGLYFFDSSTLNIPTLIYQMGDFNVQAGEKILVTMNKSLILSDDKRINQNPSININANTIGQWDVYSSQVGLSTTDAILFLSYDLKKTSEDMMCYSNQDGDVSENLMKWGFRYIHRNPSNYNIDGIFPLDQVNDFEIQRSCASYINGGSGKYLQRVSRNRRASDFTCIGCN
jgi:phosphatidylserine/phosphatidylglycerophosphate/cardiolipin synthase-like enzyme